MLEAQVRKLEASVARLEGEIEWSDCDKALKGRITFYMDGYDPALIDDTVRRFSEQLSGVSTSHLDLRQAVGSDEYVNLPMTDTQINDCIRFYYNDITRITPGTPDKYTLQRITKTPSHRWVNRLNELALYEGANFQDAVSDGFESPKVRYIAVPYTSDFDPILMCICTSVMRMVDNEANYVGRLRRITVRPVPKDMVDDLIPSNF